MIKTERLDIRLIKEIDYEDVYDEETVQYMIYWQKTKK